jgi:hypothetical protein
MLADMEEDGIGGWFISSPYESRACPTPPPPAYHFLARIPHSRPPSETSPSPLTSRKQQSTYHISYAAPHRISSHVPSTANFRLTHEDLQPWERHSVHHGRRERQDKEKDVRAREWKDVVPPARWYHRGGGGGGHGAWVQREGRGTSQRNLQLFGLDWVLRRYRRVRSIRGRLSSFEGGVGVVDTECGSGLCPDWC